MDQHKRDIIQQITWFTQLGLSLVMPLLLCILLCVYLTDRKNVGLWVYIPGFFFGLGGSGMTAYKFYLSEVGKSRKEEKKKKVSFNRHS